MIDKILNIIEKYSSKLNVWSWQLRWETGKKAMDINTIETKKNINKCKKCQCKCHCKQDLHADVYGICTCGDCKCSNPVNDGEECLSCQ
jgi:hypothetical protein